MKGIPPKKHIPIGCRAFHHVKTVGDKPVCMYCGELEEEKLVFSPVILGSDIHNIFIDAFKNPIDSEKKYRIVSDGTDYVMVVPVDDQIN